MVESSKLKVESKKDTNELFNFERLDVYKRALAFTNNVFKVTGNFPNRVQFSLGDQFRRAALSIGNNLAEGSDKTKGDKKRFYTYALDSAR